MDVLICDDNTMLADLLAEVFRKEGLSTATVASGDELDDLIRLGKPKLIVLDIMMPGTDGLALCKRIKSNPANAAVTVIVTSAKRYGEVAQESMRCGAAAFLPKPIDIPGLQLTVRKLLGLAAPKGAAPANVGAPALAALRIWGHRGAGADNSAAVETSCVSLDLDGRRVILDAGTGIRRLCAGSAPKDKDLWLLLTHYHSDHIAGLRYLRYAFDSDYTLNVAGPSVTSDSVGAIVRKGLEAGGTLKADFTAASFPEGELTLWEGLRVTAAHTMHPVTTLAYRLDFQGRKIVYCPDNELALTDSDEQREFERKLRHFARNADILLHDARYLDEEMDANAGLGHSCPSRAAALATSSGVKRLVLFHADARYSKKQLDASLEALRSRLLDAGSNLAVDLAAVDAEFPI